MPLPILRRHAGPVKERELPANAKQEGATVAACDIAFQVRGWQGSGDFQFPINQQPPNVLFRCDIGPAAFRCLAAYSFSSVLATPTQHQEYHLFTYVMACIG